MGRTDCRDILEMALCAFRFSEGGETEPSFSSGRLVPKDDFCALGAILIVSHDSSHQSQDQVDAIAGQGRELGAKARDRFDSGVRVADHDNMAANRYNVSRLSLVRST